jgi:hypothetical protein
MRGCHGSSGDCVGGIFGSDPGGEDVETRGKDVDTFAVVGEIRTSISERRGADSDCLLSCSGGVVAGILIIVSGSDGKMETGVNGSVNRQIESLGTSSTERHVCG